MKKVDKATIAALALFFVSIWVVLAAITAVWLTEEVRVFGQGFSGRNSVRPSWDPGSAS